MRRIQRRGIYVTALREARLRLAEFETNLLTEEPQNNTNTRVASGTSTTSTGIDADLTALEKLPLNLRRALHELSQDFSAAALVQELARGQYSINLIRSMHEVAQRDIERFAREYFSQTGNPYPHLAARATIQDYGLSVRPTTKRRWRNERLHLHQSR